MDFNTPTHVSNNGILMLFKACLIMAGLLIVGAVPFLAMLLIIGLFYKQLTEWITQDSWDWPTSEKDMIYNKYKEIRSQNDDGRLNGSGKTRRVIFEESD